MSTETPTPETAKALLAYRQWLVRDLAPTMRGSHLDRDDPQPPDGWEIARRLERERARLRAEVAELAAWKAEIGGAIERSGMGIMRTSEGPSGTMICYRPEVEEEHNRRTLEVIHENIDLKRERDEARREIKNGAEALEARKKLVPQCHHLPELVIGTEDGYICCECWALQAEKERDDLRAEVQALREDKAMLDWLSGGIVELRWQRVLSASRANHTLRDAIRAAMERSAE